ncbi:MAG: hypothetical protein ABJF10_22175 [Chthoniobacter sp.]|uniref:hypothetical protein n=1 Tax=Chthoniobacter sp. TaxID=2510640 RepID=UPI0032A388B2
MKTNDSHSARNGEITLFPAVIREELHERLAAGERSQRDSWRPGKAGANQAESRQIKVREIWQYYRETRAPRPMQIKEPRAKKKKLI